MDGASDIRILDQKERPLTDQQAAAFASDIAERERLRAMLGVVEQRMAAYANLICEPGEVIDFDRRVIITPVDPEDKNGIRRKPTD